MLQPGSTPFSDMFAWPLLQFHLYDNPILKFLKDTLTTLMTWTSASKIWLGSTLLAKLHKSDTDALYRQKAMIPSCTHDCKFV